MLRAVKAKRISDPRRPVRDAGEETQVLPVWRAFVVQFSRETHPRTRTFSGRVERIGSGCRDEHGERRSSLLLEYRSQDTRRSAAMMTLRPNCRPACRSKAQSVAA